MWTRPAGESLQRGSYKSGPPWSSCWPPWPDSGGRGRWWLDVRLKWRDVAVHRQIYRALFVFLYRTRESVNQFFFDSWTKSEGTFLRCKLTMCPWREMNAGSINHLDLHPSMVFYVSSALKWPQHPLCLCPLSPPRLHFLIKTNVFVDISSLSLWWLIASLLLVNSMSCIPIYSGKLTNHN